MNFFLLTFLLALSASSVKASDHDAAGSAPATKKTSVGPTEKIINGDGVTAQKPWATRLFMTFTLNGQSARSSCTGVAIGPKFILTAKHCFFPKGIKVLEKNVLILYSTGSENRLGGEKFSIKSYIWPPDSSDLALVELSTPNPITRYAKISTTLFEDVQKAKSGSSFRGKAYGYGPSVEGDKPEVYLHSMQVTFYGIFGESCEIANSETEQCIRIVSDSSNQKLAGGDSGGALMYHGDFLAGLLSSGTFDTDHNYLYANAAYITPGVYTWLAQHAKPISNWSADIWPVLILTTSH